MKAGDVAERDRIATGGKHNWDCRSRRPGSHYGGVATGRCEHRHLALNQLGREHRQAIVLTICVPIYDPDILLRGVASFPEPIMKGRQQVRCTSGRSSREEPNHWHRELLRPRRQRPRRRGTAQQRDELAPSHVCSLSPKVTPYHIVVWNAALCITANSAANVSVGSFASHRHARDPVAMSALLRTRTSVPCRNRTKKPLQIAFPKSQQNASFWMPNLAYGKQTVFDYGCGTLSGSKTGKAFR